MIAVLDGKKMTSREALHPYLQKQLHLPAHYGKNLDALWDILTEKHESLIIVFLNVDDALDSLGEYGLGLLRLFQDADHTNANITLRYQIPLNT